MPRPISNPVQIMIAAMNLKSIKDAASPGFHIQSTVLSSPKELLKERVNAFQEGLVKLYLSLVVIIVSSLMNQQTWIW